MDSALPLNHRALIMQIGLLQTDTCTYSLNDFNAFVQDKHLFSGREKKSWVLAKKMVCELPNPWQILSHYSNRY